MVDRKKPQWSWVNRIISESVNICQSAPLGGIHDVKLSSFCPRENPFPTLCARSLETFDKISRQSNQELLAQEKILLPWANNQVLRGRESDFYPSSERGRGEIWRSEKGLPAHLYLFIYIFTKLGKLFDSWDTEEKLRFWQFYNHNALTQIMRSEANHVKWTKLSLDFSALLIFLLLHCEIIALGEHFS